MVPFYSGGKNSAEVGGVFALLELLSDPGRVKQHLESVVAEKNAALAAAVDANAAVAKAEKTKNDAIAATEKMQQISVELNAAHEVRVKQLADHDTFLATKQARIEAHEAAVSKRETDLGAREAAVAAYEISTKKRETFAAKCEEDARKSAREVAMLKADYEARLAALHQALAPKNTVIVADTGVLGASMSGT
jgi:hypothetical protein